MRGIVHVPDFRSMGLLAVVVECMRLREASTWQI